MNQHFQVIVVGAGTAGIMVSSQLKKADPGINIAIIDPAETHYYQPAWTLVGADTYNFEKTARPMKSLIPAGVEWIKKPVSAFSPGTNKIMTSDSNTYEYDFLVVCPGLRMAPELVEGLGSAMETDSVGSIYTDPMKVRKMLKGFMGGTALFTQPTTPIKCGGAPQKIMYLADDMFRKIGVRAISNIVFATAGSVIFGVPEIKKTLMKVIDRKDIHLRFGHQLVAVDGKEKIAWYTMADHAHTYNDKSIEIIEDGDRVGIRYDIMHLAPPQAAPHFISNSKLSTDQGWLSVDKGTMQHTEYSNIFGLGDVAQLPTAKTGAAIRKQVPIVVENIQRLMKHQAISQKRYNGYSSCPLVTGYGKMVLAEFDYDQNFVPDPKLKQMLVFDSSKEHWRLWILKKYILPYLYWNKMMKGQNV